MRRVGYFLCALVLAPITAITLDMAGLINLTDRMGFVTVCMSALVFSILLERRRQERRSESE